MTSTPYVDTSAGTDLLLPDPEPRPLLYTIISVDDHLVEPPDMFEGRLPRKLQPLAPRVVDTPKGHQAWEFEGDVYTQPGANAVAGRRAGGVAIDPFRFEEMRPGCYNIDARIKDMNIDGVWASLNFPSNITGFSGRVYSAAKDPALGLAVTKAFNDWVYECWWQPYPDRIIPLGITFLADPELGAKEVRRNAERGFRSVSLAERPHQLGLPSIFTDYWDPIFAACEETDTVISLHAGSSGLQTDIAPGATMAGHSACLFSQLSLTACADWVWSGVLTRYPGLKIAMTEGGIGWVAMLIDRLEYLIDHSGYGKDYPGDLSPADVLRRNFWFCTLGDPFTINTREAIGIDKVMVEVDYPHGDSIWPNSQSHVQNVWGHLPVDDLRKMTHENAAALYRWPLPPETLP